jgi:hypothetical protein
VFGHSRRLVTAGFGVAMAAGALSMGLATATPAAACSQSIEPLNPFQQTCGIPNDPPVVPGASPGAGAIIACRNHPGCLSYVVNGGPGYGSLPRPNNTVQHSP